MVFQIQGSYLIFRGYLICGVSVSFVLKTNDDYYNEQIWIPVYAD